MKVFLLHRDRDFAVRPELRDEMFEAMMSGDLFAITRVRLDRERKREPSQPLAPTGNDAVLTQDLELETLWNAMAAGDEFLFEMAKRAVLSSLTDPDAIVYRQQVLADCLEHPEIIRQLYSASGRSARKRADGRRPMVRRQSRPDPQPLGTCAETPCRRAQTAAADRRRAGGEFPFGRLHALLRDAREELADDYLKAVEHHLRELEFKRGVFESAELAKGFKGGRYMVRTPREQRWTERLPFGNRSEGYSFTIPPRDENGFRSLEEIRGRGINLVANSVAQSADHVKSFFSMLRLELAFYLGCLNLHGSSPGRASRPASPNRSQPASSPSPRRGSTTSA